MDEDKKRILIVDDEPNAGETLKDVLEEYDYKVLLASSGKEALEITKQNGISVALIDLKLPDVNGLSLLQDLKSTYPEMICIIITGYATLENAMIAIKDKVDGYFKKPIAIDEMLYQIKSLISNQALRIKLKQSEEQFRLLAEQSLMGMIIFQDEMITYLNNTIHEMLGFENKDLIGLKIDDFVELIFREDRGKFIEQVKNLSNQDADTHFRGTYRIYSVSSELRTFDAYARNITHQGEPALLFAVIDVSETVQVKQDLIELNKTLEARIKERTIELEEANKAKSNFLANMSHELRTPLNSIIGFSEAILKGYLGEIASEQKEYITDILESGEHLLELINEILDLSKIEAGKLELKLEHVNVKDLVNKCRNMFKERQLRHTLDFKINIDPSIHSFIADGIKIKEVLFNLFSNAIKYTSDGGSFGLDIKVKKDEGRDEDELLFHVWDTGIGIEKNEIERLFKPFERLEPVYSASNSGTGLGLYYSKKLVELHGGKIWVESNGKDQGTSFYFSIPLLKSQEEG
ncbi:MAG: ATP-binding protein [Promethearchaeota archaeon]